MNNEITIPVETQLEVENAVHMATNLKIENDEAADLAGELMRGLKALIDKVGEVFDPIVKASKAAHQAAVDARKEKLRPLEQALEHLRKESALYVVRIEQERSRIREEEYRKAQEQAKIQREAEEAKRKAQAEALRKLNAQAKAVEVESKPVVEPVVFVPPIEPPKNPNGIHYRDKLEIRVVDPNRLCAFLLNNGINLNGIVAIYSTNLQKAIKPFVDSNKSVPGVEVYRTKIAVVSSK